MTKRESFEVIRGFIPADRVDLIEFIDHELELLAKKNSGERKPTKTQKENEILRNDILFVFESADAPMTISELIEECPKLKSLSNQKVSRAILKPLVDSGVLVRSKEKGITRFALAEDFVPAEDAE